jgi:hypothetical protein
MSAWESELIHAADAFLADVVRGWREVGIYRPPEFWADQVRDHVGGDW